MEKLNAYMQYFGYLIEMIGHICNFLIDANKPDLRNCWGIKERAE